MTKTSWFYDRTRQEMTKIRMKVTGTKQEVTMTSWFPGGRKHGKVQEPGRMSGRFDILLTHHEKLGNQI